MCTRPHFIKGRWVVLSIVFLLQDLKGNPRLEHAWPSEDYWKRKYPDLFPNSTPESAHEQEQVSHHSPIFVKVYLLILVRLSVFV